MARNTPSEHPIVGDPLVPSQRAEFHAWAEDAARHLGTPGIPRINDLRSLEAKFGSGVVQETNERFTQVGQDFPEIARARFETQKERVENFRKGARPEYVHNELQKLEKYRQGYELAREHGPLNLSLPDQAANVQRKVDRLVDHARAASRYAEQAGDEEVFHGPAGGLFYPRHGGGYRSVSEIHAPGDIERARRVNRAGAPFSANQTPTIELRGAAGLSQLDAYNDEAGVKLSDRAADAINRASARMSMTDVPHTPIESGLHSFGSLPPRQAAVLIRLLRDTNRGGGPAAKTSLSGVQFSSDWKHLVPHDDAIIGAVGSSGLPTVARSIQLVRDTDGSVWANAHRVKDPSWKVNTYSLTSSLFIGQEQELAEAAHHMIMMATHGDRYLRKYPHAAGLIKKYYFHPALHSPVNVNDIHHGRALAGIPYELAEKVGDLLRPENVLVRPKALGPDPIASRRPTGSGVTNRDLGYYGQEYATQGVDLPFHVHGRRYSMPSNIIQALGWIAQQSEDPDNIAELHAGTKSLLHAVNEQDPRTSINPAGILPSGLMVPFQPSSSRLYYPVRSFAPPPKQSRRRS